MGHVTTQDINAGTKHRATKIMPLSQIVWVAAPRMLEGFHKKTTNQLTDNGGKKLQQIKIN